MNITVLRDEYKGGCNSDIRFCWEWRWGWGVILVDIYGYLFASPLSEVHMESRHCTAAAVL